MLHKITLGFMASLLVGYASPLAAADRCQTLIGQYNEAEFTILQLVDTDRLTSGVMASTKTATNSAIVAIAANQEKMLFLMKEFRCDLGKLKFDYEALSSEYITKALLKR